MKTKGQSSIAVVALLVVVVIGLAVGYIALSGNFPGKTKSPETATEVPGSELGGGATGQEQVQNTTIATKPTRSNVSASLTARYLPGTKSHIFVCSARGFSPTTYTWDFGDGSNPLLSTNKDVLYQYDKPGSYTVNCSAADANNVAEARVTVFAS
ncbi:PKD domain-containing protein [Candidatus Woesearchaeota archaeon]|nr:PKD domain-containing protein [Candidatus Woesearchaeota archaeon]